MPLCKNSEFKISLLSSLKLHRCSFSAVNATTIQYSYSLPDTALAQATNLLWILSLVFSIASAINSQIANHWRTASYRSPPPHVPKIVDLWVTHTPLFLLGISVIAFSSGLICFAFQVFAHHFYIPVITSVCTSVTSFAIIIVGLWLAGERYLATTSARRQWLSVFVMHRAEFAYKASGLQSSVMWFVEPPISSRRGRVMVRFRSLRIRHRFAAAWGYIRRLFMDESSELPHQRPPLPALTIPMTLVPSPAGTSVGATPDLSHHRSDSGLRDSPLPLTPNLPLDDQRLSPITPVQRPYFVHTLRSVATAVLVTTGRGRPTSFHPINRNTRETEGDITPAERLARITPLIGALRLTRGPQAHSAFVKHLQFSHNGRYLATCSWDRNIIVWRVDPTFEVHKILPHPRDGRVSGLSWSKDGVLLSRSYQTVQLWDVEVGRSLR